MSNDFIIGDAASPEVKFTTIVLQLNSYGRINEFIEDILMQIPYEKRGDFINQIFSAFEIVRNNEFRTEMKVQSQPPVNSQMVIANGAQSAIAQLMFVHTDIIHPRLFRDTQAKFLRIIPCVYPTNYHVRVECGIFTAS